MTGAAGAKFADGFRPADGAIIDAKYVRNEKDSCFTPNNENGRPDWIYQKIMGDETAALQVYGGVLQNPANHAQFLEIETNNPLAALYFQVQLGPMHGNGKARLVP